VLRGNGGNDTIDGGAGIDTAVFSGLRSSYTLTTLSAHSLRVIGPDGIDRLNNIEKLAFDDQTITWTPVPWRSPSSVTTPTAMATAISYGRMPTAHPRPGCSTRAP